MVAFESLVPVFLIILTGWSLKNFGFIHDTSWNGLEKITYHIFMPALVATTIATTNFEGLDVPRILMLALAPGVVIGSLLVFFRETWQRLLAIDSPSFTSLFQGSVRWNAFVGFGLSLQLHGKPGLSILSVAICALVPFANISSAYLLSRHGRAGKPVNLVALLRSLAINPFIWSTALGLLIKFSGLKLPQIVLIYGDILGRGALAAGLLLVGSGLLFSSLRASLRPLSAAVILKLLVSPVIAGELGMFLGLSGPALAVPVIVAAAPTAAASFILAKQNGGDPDLMATITTVQTLIALVTIPLILLRYST
jgi:malonate transporter and related proteins